MANEQNLKPFIPGYDPRRNLKGRDKLTDTILRDLGYTKEQENMARRILKAMTIPELREVAENEEAKSVERIIAKCLIKDFEKSSQYNLETITTRVDGQPKQEIDQRTEMTVKINIIKASEINGADTESST